MQKVTSRDFPCGKNSNERGVKPASGFRTASPGYLGLTIIDGRWHHAFSSGETIPLIGGGAVVVDLAAASNLPLLLTVPEAARQLGVVDSTVWAMISRGDIESIVVGARSRRIPRDALVSYITSLRQER